ncbi:MAG TPA: hypothetical protein VNG12_00100 [Acidimicrobiales bacterium]|nr:hypothetical protein [Acidimicrobiales bacterium]
MTFKRFIDARSGQTLSNENATLIQQAHQHLAAVASDAGINLTALTALGDHQNVTTTATPGTVVAEIQRL